LLHSGMERPAVRRGNSGCDDDTMSRRAGRAVMPCIHVFFIIYICVYLEELPSLDFHALKYPAGVVCADGEAFSSTSVAFCCHFLLYFLQKEEFCRHTSSSASKLFAVILIFRANWGQLRTYLVSRMLHKGRRSV
jgi:hypothetical protein